MFTVAATALRASEVIALRWSDIMWKENRIRVSKRWRKGKDGKPKTAASDSTVALGSILAHYLRAWKEASPYTADTDFVFPSMKKERCGSSLRVGVRQESLASGCDRGWRKDP